MILSTLYYIYLHAASIIYIIYIKKSSSFYLFLKTDLPEIPDRTPSNIKPRVQTHAKRSHMHVKDSVVHVRIRWTVEISK